MDAVKRLTDWRERHKGLLIIPLLRVVLGVAILAKTIIFIVQGDQMESIMMNTTNYLPFLFGHWIPVLEIAAGILISIGLLTRASAIFQIPLFAAALLFSKHNAVLASFEQSRFLLSTLILVLSIFFAFWGSGLHSAKKALQDENRREEDHFWHRNTNE